MWKTLTEEEKRITWDDVLTASFDRLHSISREWREAIDYSGRRSDRFKEFAHLRACDLAFYPDFEQVEAVDLAKSVAQKLKRGEMDPDVADLILDNISYWSGDRKPHIHAARFQRVYGDKQTSMSLFGKGTIYESVYVFPDDQRVRLLHHVFKDQSRKDLAEIAQRYFYELVEHAKSRVENQADEHSRYLAERLARAKPILPLSTRGKKITNLYVGDTDLSDRFLHPQNIQKEIESRTEAATQEALAKTVHKQYREGYIRQVSQHIRDWMKFRSPDQIIQYVSENCDDPELPRLLQSRPDITDPLEIADFIDENYKKRKKDELSQGVRSAGDFEAIVRFLEAELHDDTHLLQRVKTKIAEASAEGIAQYIEQKFDAPQAAAIAQHARSFTQADEITTYLNQAIPEAFNYTILERVAEVNDIDIITGIFSDSYKRTRAGRRHYSGWLGRTLESMIGSGIPTVNYRDEVFEDILLPIDPALRRQLEEENLVSNGKIKNRKRFGERFYNGNDNQYSKVLELLGVDNETDNIRKVFTNSDPSPKNIITSENGERYYTHIDFEGYKEEDLIAALPNRAIRAGLYDYNGTPITVTDSAGQDINAEEFIIKNAYETYTRAHNVTGQDPITEEQFRERYQKHKKKFLLRTARRLKMMEPEDHDKEHVKQIGRYFYTLFRNEVLKETDPDGTPRFDESHSGIQYLDQLFDNPLSPEEMQSIYENDERGNPARYIARHFNPRGIDDAILASTRKASKIARNNKLLAAWERARIPAAMLSTVLTASAVIGLFGHFITLESKVQQAEINLEYEEKSHLPREFYKLVTGMQAEFAKDPEKYPSKNHDLELQQAWVRYIGDYDESWEAKEIWTYYRHFKDLRMACAASIHFTSLCQAAEILNLKEELKQGKISYDDIEETLKEINPRLYQAMLGISKTNKDAVMDFYHANPHQDHIDYLIELGFDELEEQLDTLKTRKKSSPITNNNPQIYDPELYRLPDGTIDYEARKKGIEEALEKERVRELKEHFRIQNGIFKYSQNN